MKLLKTEDGKRRIDKSSGTFQAHGELKVAYNKVYKRTGHLDNPRENCRHIDYIIQDVSLAANWLCTFRRHAQLINEENYFFYTPWRP